MAQKVGTARKMKSRTRDNLLRPNCDGDGKAGNKRQAFYFINTHTRRLSGDMGPLPPPPPHWQGLYKCFTSLSEIERKFYVFVGILEKGDSDALQRNHYSSAFHLSNTYTSIHGGRLSLITISFCPLSLLFGSCRLSEFTLAGPLSQYTPKTNDLGLEQAVLTVFPKLFRILIYDSRKSFTFFSAILEIPGCLPP